MEYNTDDLKRKDINHNIHPWTNFATFKEEGSLVMAKSNGNYVYDTEGNKYLDGIAGLWCVNIGYRHHTMVKAIADQINEITYYTTFGHVVTPTLAHFINHIWEILFNKTTTKM